jgi:hypothetical protein
MEVSRLIDRMGLFLFSFGGVEVDMTTFYYSFSHVIAKDYFGFIVSGQT